MKQSTSSEIRTQIRRLRREANERRASAEHYYSRIDRLTGEDPEDREAARDWRRYAQHAEYCAAEADRYADRLEQVAS